VQFAKMLGLLCLSCHIFSQLIHADFGVEPK
jgi:hypothetical protein